MVEKLDIHEIDTKKEVLQELKDLKKEFRRIRNISRNDEIDNQAKLKEKLIGNYRQEVRRMEDEKDAELILAYQPKINELRKLKGKLKEQIPGSSDEIRGINKKLQESKTKRNIEEINKLGELASLSLFNKASNEIKEILQGIISGKIDASLFAQYYSKSEYKEYIDGIYYQAKEKNPILYTEIKARYKNCGLYLDNKGNLLYQKPVDQKSNNNASSESQLGTNMSRYSDMSWKDTFKKGGIAGSVRKVLDIFPNMKEGTKSTWTSLAMAGAVGWGLWKVGKYLFTGKLGLKDEKGNEIKHSIWKRLGLGALTFFGFNAFGTNPLSAANKLLFGGIDLNDIKMRWPWSFENTIEDTDIKTAEIASIFSIMKLSDMQQYLNKDMKFKENNGESSYDLILGKLEASGDKKGVEILKKIGKNDEKGVLKKYLGILGINSYDDFDKIGKKKTISDLMTDKQTIEDYLGDKLKFTEGGKKEIDSYKLKNNVTKEYLDQMEKGGKIINIEVQKWKDLNDKTKTKTKETLNKTNLPVAEKIAIQKTMNMLYEKVDDKAKAKLKLNIDANGNIAGLSSYGQILKLNYKDEEIDGLDMSFNDIDELFKIANLINKLKDITKDNSTNLENQTNPFNSTNFNTWIGDFGTVSFDKIKDTSIFSKGFWNSLVGNDLTLLRGNGGIAVLKTDEGKKKLASYLNNRRNTEVSSNRNSANIN